MNLQIFLFLSACCLFVSSEAKKGKAMDGEPDAGGDAEVPIDEPEMTKISPDNADEKTEQNSIIPEPKPVESENKPVNQKLKNDRKTAAELQDKIEVIHKNDPRSPLQLAQRTLQKAFMKFNNGERVVKMSELLRSLETITAGKMLLFTFRMFEFMDTNNDYAISEEEFTSSLIGATAQPDKLIELMFHIQDYNADGVLSQYEFYQSEALSLGVNYNQHDMWKSAQQSTNDMDSNNDAKIDLSEYTNFVVYQINKAIVQQRADSIK